MKYTKCQMNRTLLKEICNWKYEGEYSVYNPPSYQTLIERNAAIADDNRNHNYICYLDEKGNLQAYTSITQRGNDIYLGIALNPQLCGKGVGTYIGSDLVVEAMTRYPGMQLKTEIKAWNKRSIKVCERTGFAITKHFKPLILGENKEEYVELTYNKNKRLNK